MKIGIEAQRMLRHHRHGMDVVALEMLNHLQIIDSINQYYIFNKQDKNWEGVKRSPNFNFYPIEGGNYVYWEQIKLPIAVQKCGIDILHCTANTAPIKKKVPLILTLHDIIFMEKTSFEGTAYQNFGNIYRRLILSKIIKNCDDIITVSDYEKDRICNYFQLTSERVTTIYNGINTNFKVIDKQSLQDTRQKYDLPQNFILFFANPAPKKNAVNTLKAYSKYLYNTQAPLSLVLTDTSPIYIQKIIEEHKLFNITQHLKIIDYISYLDIARVYNLAQLFLYLSTNESFGMPLIESMACGTPVLASNIGALKEVGGGAAYFVSPDDINQIAEAIAMISSDANISESLSSKGLRQAQNFSWLKNAQQILDIYKKYE